MSDISKDFSLENIYGVKGSEEAEKNFVNSLKQRTLMPVMSQGYQLQRQEDARNDRALSIQSREVNSRIVTAILTAPQNEEMTLEERQQELIDRWKVEVEPLKTDDGRSVMTGQDLARYQDFIAARFGNYTDEDKAYNKVSGTFANVQEGIKTAIDENDIQKVNDLLLEFNISISTNASEIGDANTKNMQNQASMFSNIAKLGESQIEGEIQEELLLIHIPEIEKIIENEVAAHVFDPKSPLSAQESARDKAQDYIETLKERKDFNIGHLRTLEQHLNGKFEELRSDNIDKNEAVERHLTQEAGELISQFRQIEREDIPMSEKILKMRSIQSDWIGTALLPNQKNGYISDYSTYSNLLDDYIKPIQDRFDALTEAETEAFNKRATDRAKEHEENFNLFYQEWDVSEIGLGTDPFTNYKPMFRRFANSMAGAMMDMEWRLDESGAVMSPEEKAIIMGEARTSFLELRDSYAKGADEILQGRGSNEEKAEALKNLYKRIQTNAINNIDSSALGGNKDLLTTAIQKINSPLGENFLVIAGKIWAEGHGAVTQQQGSYTTATWTDPATGIKSTESVRLIRDGDDWYYPTLTEDGTTEWRVLGDSGDSRTQAIYHSVARNPRDLLEQVTKMPSSVFYPDPFLPPNRSQEVYEKALGGSGMGSERIGNFTEPIIIPGMQYDPYNPPQSRMDIFMETIEPHIDEADRPVIDKARSLLKDLAHDQDLIAKVIAENGNVKDWKEKLRFLYDHEVWRQDGIFHPGSAQGALKKVSMQADFVMRTLVNVSKNATGAAIHEQWINNPGRKALAEEINQAFSELNKDPANEELKDEIEVLRKRMKDDFGKEPPNNQDYFVSHEGQWKTTFNPLDILKHLNDIENNYNIKNLKTYPNIPFVRVADPSGTMLTGRNTGFPDLRE